MTSAAYDLDDLLDLARSTALAAGELALARRRAGVEVAATKSSPVDIVTQADRDAEDLIRRLLSEARPGDGFLGEESDGESGTSGLTWVVDPIDGTVNFLYGIPAWAVSIAVVEGDPDPRTWRALAGAVVNPMSGEVFTAATGRGAYLGDRRLTVGSGAPLDRALIGTGFSYRMEPREKQIEVAGTVLRRARDIRRIGAASLDLCSVADGRLDAYYEKGLHPWDHAAGALIAVEAGAVVVGDAGGPADAELLVAGATALVDELMPLLAGLRS